MTSFRVAVAVSGGVDSLCALILLQKAGLRPLALHGLFLPEAEEPPQGLVRACKTLHIPLHVVDVRETFYNKVMTPFAKAYAQARTPNPCALCNRAIKFGVLQDAALALGVQFFATGHYARLVPNARQNALVLATASDTAKDQSYFLSLVPQERLRHALFPLQDMSKARCREVVAAAGLDIPLPHESQDICFAPQLGARSGDEGYRSFLERHWRQCNISPPGCGQVVLRNADGSLQPIARHNGLWRFTEGQRRGLGIAWSEALFVLAKDRDSNTLVVGPRTALGITACHTGPANIAVPQELWPSRLLVRLRYRHRPTSAKVSLEAGRLRIALPERLFPTAPGQIAAVYAEDGRLLAAGIVEHMI